MPQTLQQESLIAALSKYAIKIGIEKISEKFNCFVLKPFLCQQGRFTKIRSHIMIKLLQSLPKESPQLVEPKSDKVDLPHLKVDCLKYCAAGMFSNNEAAAQWWSGGVISLSPLS